MRMGGKLRDAIVELYRKVSTELPSDVVEGLRKAIGMLNKIPLLSLLTYLFFYNFLNDDPGIANWNGTVGKKFASDVCQSSELSRENVL